MNKSILVVVVGGFIMLLPFLTSCGRVKSNKSVSDIITDEMNNKYGIEVEIVEFEEKSGNQAFAEGWHHAVAECDGNRFDVYVGKESGEIKDDYAKHLLGKRIESEMQSVFDMYKSMGEYDYKVMYVCSPVQWTTESDLGMYFETTGSYVSVYLNPDGASPEETADLVYDFAKELADRNIYFSIRCTYRDNTVFISNNNTAALSSREKIKSKFVGDN